MIAKWHLSPWLFEEDGRNSSIGYENVRTWQDDNLSGVLIGCGIL